MKSNRLRERKNLKAPNVREMQKQPHAEIGGNTVEIEFKNE